LAGYLEEIVLPPTSTTPDAPTGLIGVAGNAQATISFTPGADGGSAITNYQYSTDDGVTFTAFSPAVTSSPVTITGLTNGVSYSIKLKAVNANGAGTASLGVSVTPSTTPDAPTGLVATAGNAQATISFTPGFDGGSPITNYQYSTDNGATFTAFSPSVTSSPVTITGLTNGVSYTIKLKAVNANGAGTASLGVSVTPSTTPDAPTSLVATAGDSQAIISFIPGANGGSAITNYQYSTDNGVTFTAFSPSVTTSPVTITGLTNGVSYTIKLKAVNTNGAGTASAGVSVTPVSPSGSAIWATYLNGTNTDIGYSVAVDSLNNLYVTGQYNSSSIVILQDVSGNGQTPSSVSLPAVLSNAAFLIKYNSSGQAQWATYLDGTNTDIGYSVAVDSLNNLYVTGQYQSTSLVTLQNASGNGQAPSSITLPITSSTAAFIMKYNSNGQAQWATYLDGTSGDIGYSVAVDSSNNIYITGQYQSTSLVTLQDASGNSQTNSSITLPIVSTNAVFLIKYNSSGQVQWATYFNGTGNDIGNSVAVDSSNNLYITGQYQSTSLVNLQDASGNTQTPSLVTLPAVSNSAAVIMKYKSNGQAQWATYFDGTSFDRGQSIALDSSNNIYITGVYSSTTIITLQNVSGNTQTPSLVKLPVSGSSAAFLVKYNLSGQVQWATYIDGAGNEIGYSIGINPSNNIYITGRYASSSITLRNASGNGQTLSSVSLPSSSGIGSVFLVKYNSSGQVQWATYLYSYTGYSILIDSSNNLYLTGQYTSSSVITLQNASGNTQSPSSITLPAAASPNSAAFLVKYNS
jgi:hypothetical protein